MTKVVNGRVYSSKVDGYLRAGDVRFADLNGDNVIGAGAGTVDDPGDNKSLETQLPDTVILSVWMRAGTVSTYPLSSRELVKETGTHLIVPPHREQIHSGDHILSLLPHL